MSEDKFDLKILKVDDHSVLIERPTKRYRFLFDDGTTADVLADRDDSDMRGAVLKWFRKTQIVGVAVVPPEVQGALLVGEPDPETTT